MLSGGLPLALIVACASPAAPGVPPPVVRAFEGEPPVERATLGVRGLRGVSGLAEGPGGAFYAVPERERLLFPLRLDEGTVTVERPLVIEGVPEALDLEALAFIDAHTVAFGTESRQKARQTDLILLGRLEGDRVVVAEAPLVFDYRPLGVSAKSNHGIEGLCAAGRRLIAASEAVGERRGKRFAPLGVFDLEARTWTHHRLWLTSREGKIAGLTCRLLPGGAVELLAIERHWGVSRVISAELPPPDGEAAPCAPPACSELPAVVLRDLAPSFPGNVPNFEGLARLAAEGLLLISDDDYGSVTGPTLLIRLGLSPRSPDSPASPLGEPADASAQ